MLHNTIPVNTALCLTLSFFLLFLLLIKLVKAEGRDVGSSADAGDLSSQVIGFSAREGWIGYHLWK